MQLLFLLYGCINKAYRQLLYSIPLNNHSKSAAATFKTVIVVQQFFSKRGNRSGDAAAVWRQLLLCWSFCLYTDLAVYPSGQHLTLVIQQLLPLDCCHSSSHNKGKATFPKTKEHYRKRFQNENVHVVFVVCSNKNLGTVCPLGRDKQVYCTWV
jgi:hypothetical protein